MSTNIELSMEEELHNGAGVRLKVIGVGGAGNNAVNSMVLVNKIDHVECIVANTDAQTLGVSPVRCKVQLGKKITKGLGAGSNPEVGRRAAEEDLESIMAHVADADILFLTAGLGGGTGSGALPVIARAAKEHGILTVAVVTKPFGFEGKRRAKHAEDALQALEQTVDTLIVVPNQRLLELVDQSVSMLDAFAQSNEILAQAIKGISDIITKPGHINVDFADVRTIMKDMGMAMMGTGRASGKGRALEAAKQAISSPLLENVNINGARGVLINISGSSTLGLHEINEAASLIYELVSQDATIILGSVLDDSMGDELAVTVIATGFGQPDVKPVAVATVVKEALVEEPKQPQTVYAARTEPAPAPIPQQVAVPYKSPVEASMDLHDLDTPTFLRKKAQQEAGQHQVQQPAQQQQQQRQPLPPRQSTAE